MNQKVVVILEILAILGASIYLFITDVIPDYKKSLGSSDSFIKSNDYHNMVEFQIDHSVNFALVISKQKKVSHLFFFDKNATCLYNQNIEGKTIFYALEIVIKKLIEDDFLTSKASIKLVRYGDFAYDDIYHYLEFYTNKYGLSNDFLEEKNSLKELYQSLKLGAMDDESAMLRNLDYYSKEFCRTNISSNNQGDLNDENARSYTKHVYQKLENYILENNIKNADKNQVPFQIQMIPADSLKKYYPTAKSWYYVRNGKIYAYIELLNDEIQYGYCYEGSIDKNRKGEC